MAFSISGLDPAPFTDGDLLVATGALRVRADRAHAFPCRVTLEDAAPGERMLLLNHVSADVATPFRASHAIVVREGARAAARCQDAVPPMIGRRTVSLRGFDPAGLIRSATLAAPGEAEAGLRTLLRDPHIDHVDIHTAAWGCFLARAERHGDA